MREGNLHLDFCHLRGDRDLQAGIGTRAAGTHNPGITSRILAVALVSLAALLTASPCLAQQDWIRTGTGLGVDKVRIAVPDFKPGTPDPKNADLQKVFDATLFSDLDNAGIFDLVSKSFYPLDVPGSPTEVHFDAWSNPPVTASMLVFGDLGVTGANVTVHGWLYDLKNSASPQVLGK